MLYQEMIVKIQKDLGIPEHRARGYVKMFSEEYKGRKEAISDVKGSYSDDGHVKITYTINNKKHSIVLDGKSPYSREYKRKVIKY